MNAVREAAERLENDGLLKEASLSQGENRWYAFPVYSLIQGLISYRKDADVRSDKIRWLSSLAIDKKEEQTDDNTGDEKTEKEEKGDESIDYGPIARLVKGLDGIRHFLNSHLDFESEETQVANFSSPSLPHLYLPLFVFVC